MGDTLQIVADGVRIVVHRVDAPFVARAVVRGVQDAVDDGIAHVDVGGSHVDFRAQALFAVLILARLHLLEELEVLLGGAVPIRAFGAGFCEGAAGVFDFLGRQIAHERLALLDESDGIFVDGIEKVGGVALARPFVTEPVDVGADGVDELRLFLGGVGIVEEQVALAAVFERGAEVDEHALGMPDVQVAVRLGREARLHLVGAQLARGDVLVDDLLDEVGCFW